LRAREGPARAFSIWFVVFLLLILIVVFGDFNDERLGVIVWQPREVVRHPDHIVFVGNGVELRPGGLFDERKEIPTGRLCEIRKHISSDEEGSHEDSRKRHDKREERAHMAPVRSAVPRKVVDADDHEI
jgi:hypothetical protein